MVDAYQVISTSPIGAYLSQVAQDIRFQIVHQFMSNVLTQCTSHYVAIMAAIPIAYPSHECGLIRGWRE
jgi:hypothetical protein